MPGAVLGNLHGTFTTPIGRCYLHFIEEEIRQKVF